MKSLSVKVECPNCNGTVNVPFFEKLEAKAVEDWDLAEISAQEELSGLRFWLATASLWELVKWWVRRFRYDR